MILGLLDIRNELGIARIMIAIFVVDNFFQLLDDILNSKISTAIEVVEGRDIILIIVDAFGFSYLEIQKNRLSSGSRISEMPFSKLADFWISRIFLEIEKRIVISFLV